MIRRSASVTMTPSDVCSTTLAASASPVSISRRPVKSSKAVRSGPSAASPTFSVAKQIGRGLSTGPIRSISQYSSLEPSANMDRCSARMPFVPRVQWATRGLPTSRADCGRSMAAAVAFARSTSPLRSITSSPTGDRSKRSRKLASSARGSSPSCRSSRPSQAMFATCRARSRRVPALAWAPRGLRRTLLAGRCRPRVRMQCDNRIFCYRHRRNPNRSIRG